MLHACWPITVALTLLSACERQSSTQYITPWFKQEVDSPWIDIPHVLKWGGQQTHEHVFVNGWHEVHRGHEWPGTVALFGNEWVLIRRTAQLYRQGSQRPIQLPRDKCPKQFLYSVDCLDGRKVACLHILPLTVGRACVGLEVSIYDLDGQRVGHFEVQDSNVESCRWSASDEDFNSRAIAGFDSDGSPVVALRLAQSMQSYSVVKLTPSGYTAVATLERAAQPAMWSWPYDLKPLLAKHGVLPPQCH